MDFRIINVKETVVYGVSKEYDTQKYLTREALRHSMWDAKSDSVPEKISSGKRNQPQNQAFDGVWCLARRQIYDCKRKEKYQ